MTLISGVLYELRIVLSSSTLHAVIRHNGNNGDGGVWPLTGIIVNILHDDDGSLEPGNEIVYNEREGKPVTTRGVILHAILNERE